MMNLQQNDPQSAGTSAQSDPADVVTPSVRVKVHAIRRVADSVIEIELRGLDAAPLPSFSAGAHIALHLPNGLTRSYSLTNSQEERQRYIIAVGLDAKTRGGSQFIHEHLQTGDVLSAEAPRNNFPFDEDAGYSVFIAGGIGVTPYLSMARRATQLKRGWEMHYCARSRSNAAFLEELTSLAGENGRLVTHFDDESMGKYIDLRQLISASPQNAHFYCCGPEPMLAAFRDSTSSFPASRIHFEYFSQAEEAERTGGFTVRLARQNRAVYVPPGRTILEALHAEGIEAPSACREGVCGTCEVRVLEGAPIHRDSVLTTAEREGNQTMMICCSGSRTSFLTIDM